MLHGMGYNSVQFRRINNKMFSVHLNIHIATNIETKPQENVYCK